ncbi:TonB-dependent hemoglobin/transferrin/lactoferrin family receptor [Rhodospira trueperi]|uniref:Hemoglobin/transferrin/lactoferrin receptor protein n=1 Tax=Rhodospira trueperi TaxID=69960 RepID=A0A1G7HA42_9PROT|nr:TonB-dependent hemoglobin/transferrin/lactoferrin family receptor [Rhodospira trueperi]SDE97255.1 hemoglobin/transferrin/lactoferrin receptor protein [Rhodospira trueperi]
MVHSQRPRPERLALSLSLLGGVMVASHAHAQTTDESIATTAGAVRLPTVSVTATRNEIDPFAYPGMVSVIGREDLGTLQPSTPDDVLKLVPNVSFSGGPRRTGEVPSIRGFSGADVVILLDGARQTLDGGHDGRFFLDPSLLRGVEVLRGPASSLYGSGGTGGVIAFRTVEVDDYLDPGETFGVTTGLGGQTVNDEWSVTTTAYGRPLDGVDLLGSVTRRTSGSIELGSGETLDDADDSILSGLLKGGIDLGDHRIEASFSHFSNDAEEPNNGQGEGQQGLVEKATGNDTVRLAYSYDNPDDNLIDLDAVVYYNRTTVDEVRLDGLGAGPVGELLERTVETIGLRAENRSRFAFGEDTHLTLTYGGEAYQDTQEGATNGQPRAGAPDAEATFAGVFAQAELTLTRPLGLPGEVYLLPGLRFDHYDLSSDVADSDTVESRLSPRFGVTYRPADWAMVFANYGEAFRAPTFTEMYLTGTHFQIPMGPTTIVNRFIPNPDLKPQTTRTVEFGAGVDFEDVFAPRDMLNVKVSHFRQWGEDFIDLSVNQPALGWQCFGRPGACDGTTTSTNVPHAFLWGTEIEGRYETDRIRLSLGFASIDGENSETGEKLGALTPNTVTLDAGVKLPEVDALVGWRAKLASYFDKVDDPDEERDAYDVHDLYAVYQPSDGLLEGLRVDLGIDNVFDEDYSRVYTGVSEAGRNFKAMVQYSLAW